MKVDLYHKSGQSDQKISLPASIFNVNVKPSLIAQAVRVYLSNQRQKGTASSKTRSEVVGSTHKIYKQKGTGRARHGDRKAPIFVGGSKAHGPTGQENYQLHMGKKMRRKALFGALTLKLKENKLIVVDELLTQPKTKALNQTFTNLDLNTKSKKLKIKTLLVLPEKADNFSLAGRNIANLELVFAPLLNIYQVMNAGKIVFLADSIKLFEKTYKQHGK